MLKTRRHACPSLYGIGRGTGNRAANIGLALDSRFSVDEDEEALFKNLRVRYRDRRNVRGPHGSRK